MTYEELLVAIDAEAPNLKLGPLRLLLRLVGLGIQQGTHVLQASDRYLGKQLGLSSKGMTTAKKELANLVAITSTNGVATTFEMPAEWFTPQRSLFVSTGALLERAPRTPQEGAGAFPESAPAPSPGVHSALPQRAPALLRSAQVHSPGGQSTLLERAPALLGRAPDTQNQQHSNGSSTRLDSTQTLTTTEELSRLDRIFHTVQISEAKLPDALRLRLALHAFMQQCGSARAADRPPKDEILAKCLAIAGVDELLIALREVSNSRKCNPNAYIWFVVVFLDQIAGVPWKVTAEYIKQQKERKPPQRQAAASFQQELVAQAGNQVKRLR